MKHDTIAILDYGSQTAQLIARRVRELHVYCELIPWDAPAERFAALDPRGFILSGGPTSVYEPGAPRLPDFRACFRQAGARHLLRDAASGAAISAAASIPSARREYGHAGADHRRGGRAAAPRPAARAERLDEPRRSRGRPAADLCAARDDAVVGRGDGRR